MVYTASLNLVAKKAYGAKCRQSSVTSLIEGLAIDPSNSYMDVVLLGPKDFTGGLQKRLVAAVEARHPNVCVIYLCTSDKEAKLFPSAPHTKVVRKITATAITEAVNEFYGSDVKATERQYTSVNDTVQDFGTNPEPEVVAPVVKTPEVEPETPVIEPTFEAPPMPELPAEPPSTRKALTPEEMIASVRSVGDWSVLHKQIERDSIIRQLILENSEFAGISNMLDVWDLRIRDIWADPNKSSGEKLKAVQDFGKNRQVLQASYNSVLVEKFISLMERVISVCVATVEERANELSTAVASIQANKDAFIRETLLAGKDVDEELFSSMLEMQAMQGELCKMMAYLHHQGMDEIVDRLGEKLPSTNEHINGFLSESAGLYVPGNSANLAQAILDALSSGKMQLSMVEDKLKGLMYSMFNVITKQDREIQYIKKANVFLQANHVENIVVRDSLLKNCFRILVGKEGTGLSSTAATYAGMLSRRENVLLVDVTGHPHYDRYGYASVPLDEFMVERIQRQLLIVTGNLEKDPERVFHFMEELKARTSYYPYIFVVMDPSQLEMLDQLGREALSISYITNCTRESMDAISAVYEVAKKLPNVGHKLLCIDSPVDAGTIVEALGMDVTLTQLIPIPYLREMRKAAIVGQQPHTYNDVLRVFEEAFRV